MRISESLGDPFGFTAPGLLKQEKAAAQDAEKSGGLYVP